MLYVRTCDVCLTICEAGGIFCETMGGGVHWDTESFCLCSLKNRETKSFLRFFFTPRSHAAESLPGFIVDNHKIFLMVVVGGGGLRG